MRYLSWLRYIYYGILRTLRPVRPYGWVLLNDLELIIPRTVPKAEIGESREITASLFFLTVFKSERAARELNILIFLSSFGGVIATLVGKSRIMRDCGRFADKRKFARFQSSVLIMS